MAAQLAVSTEIWVHYSEGPLFQSHSQRHISVSGTVGYGVRSTNYSNLNPWYHADITYRQWAKYMDSSQWSRLQHQC